MLSLVSIKPAGIILAKNESQVIPIGVTHL
jgi:hypothetical protein